MANRGNHKEHQMAGKKGGERTAQEKGDSFFSKIGRKGGKSRSNKNDRSR